MNKIFSGFSSESNVKRFSRYTGKGAVFAEQFNRAICNLLKKPVFEKGNGDFLSDLPSVIRKYNNTVHNSSKKTPIQANKKANEDLVNNNLKDDREKQHPKNILGQLTRTADIK